MDTETLPLPPDWTGKNYGQEWVNIVAEYLYSGNNYTGSDGQQYRLSEEAKAWVDKYMCLAKDWNDDDGNRRAAGKMCKWNLTQDNMNYVGLVINRTFNDARPRPSVYTGHAKLCAISRFVSSESFINLFIEDAANGTENHVITQMPTDYVTIHYYKGVINTGNLKIISLDIHDLVWLESEPGQTQSRNNKKRPVNDLLRNAGSIESKHPAAIELISKKLVGRTLYGYVNNADKAKETCFGGWIYSYIVQTNWTEFPLPWKWAMCVLAQSAEKKSISSYGQ